MRLPLVGIEQGLEAVLGLSAVRHSVRYRKSLNAYLKGRIDRETVYV